MDTRPAFGFKELFTFLIGDMAKAICERNGEPQQQKITRAEAATHMIMGFLPRDVIEAMLAGHCVMFHELLIDTTRQTLLGELDSTRRATRSGIVAMDKCFGNNLSRLEQYQMRHAEGQRDAPEARTAAPQAETEMVDRTPGPVAPSPVASAPAAQAQAPTTAETRDVSRPNPPVAEAPPEITGNFQPSPEAIAACRANPDAMAALDAGDAEAFARAMGVDIPSEAYLAAAGADGNTFDRQPASAPPPPPTGSSGQARGAR